MKESHDQVSYPALSDAEIEKIIKFVTEQNRGKHITVGRMRYIMSYWIRYDNMCDGHPFLRLTAGMAKRHIPELLQEINRLRGVLKDISTGTTDSTTQAIALEALAEPDLGPPDIVCRTGDIDNETGIAAASMFTDKEFKAWKSMGEKVCHVCGTPLRPCPKGPGADEPGYVGFYPCRHDGEDLNR